MQMGMVWKQSRHHVLPQQFMVLQAFAGRKEAATFSFKAAAAQLGFLWSYQLLGKFFLPLGALMEMSAAAIASCLGDANLADCTHAALCNACMPGLALLPELLAAASMPLCMLTIQEGQISAASGDTALCCFSALLGYVYLRHSPESDSAQAMMSIHSPAKVSRGCFSHVVNLSMLLLAIVTGSDCNDNFHQSVACLCVQKLLLSTACGVAAKIQPLQMHARLACLTPSTADGFLLHPAVLQAAAIDCKTGNLPGPPVPVVVDFLCMPTAAAVAENATCGAADSSISLTTAVGARSSGMAAKLQGLRYCAAQQLDSPMTEAAHTVHPVDLLYEVEWQADDSLAGTQVDDPMGGALLHPSLASKLLSTGGRRARPLGMCQAASLAAASVVQLLQSYKTASFSCVCVQSVASLPALRQVIPPACSTSAAAASAILNNLPYEMPVLDSNLLDLDANSCGTSSQSSTLSLGILPLNTSPESDIYGVAARGRALYRPLLMYSRSVVHSDGSIILGSNDRRGSYVVTGGLGGLGMLTASWFTNSGVRALALLSRSGLLASSSDSARVTNCRALLVLLKCDVAYAEGANLMASIENAHCWQFQGIFHTAGLQVGTVLADFHMQSCITSMRLSTPFWAHEHVD